MKIIIYGASEIATLIAKEFHQIHEITIIDKEEKKTEDLSRLDICFINSEALTIDTLKNANIKSADIFISTTATDEINILACLTVKRMCSVKTICFVSKEQSKTSLGLTRDSEYAGSLFIDHIIWPEELLTKEIFQIVTIEKALDAENFANGRARLLEYKLDAESILVGKKVRECDFPDECLIVGITREDKLFIPYGETVLEENDKIIFMGLSAQLSILAARFFHEKNYSKSITIIGGGNVGLMLAKNLEKSKVHIKIIEKNLKRCEHLAEVLSNTLIINGDGTDLELLTQEEIPSSDAVISVTNNDEKNLLCSLLAKQLGVKRIVSRVSKDVNIPLFDKVGIDITVSPNINSQDNFKTKSEKAIIDSKDGLEKTKDENDNYENIDITKLNDQEINDLKYEIALKIDKRTYFEYYWSLLKKKHLILFTFWPTNDYNLYTIKVSLFLLSFGLYISINGFFFSDDTMHKLYEDKGKYNIIYRIPQILFSTIISAVINVLLKKLSLTEANILSIKEEKDNQKMLEKSKSIKKCLRIKFIIYFALSILFMLFFWYFISCFCAVYKNTQIVLIKDTLVSYALSMAYPFGLNLLPGLFRIPALKAEKGDRGYRYKLGQLVAFI